MLDEPQIMQTSDQITAVIRLTITRSELRTVMRPGIRELMAAVAAQGVPPTGPWFNHHLKMDRNTLDFDAVGRVKPGLWPAGARCVLRGTMRVSTPDPAAWRTELTRPLVA